MTVCVPVCLYTCLCEMGLFVCVRALDDVRVQGRASARRGSLDTRSVCLFLHACGGTQGQRDLLLQHPRGAVRFVVVVPSKWNVFSSPSVEPIPSCSVGLKSTSLIQSLTHSFIHSTKYGLSPPQTLPSFLQTARLASSLNNNDCEGPGLSNTNQVITRQALCSDFPSISWLNSHDTR